MQWTDVIKPPSTKMLRQFAGLFLVVFLGLATWRWFHGQTGVWTNALAALAVIVGVTGLVFPALVKPIYTGWMIAAFPIGWTVSRIALALVFFVVLTPLAAVFRMMGRDLLRLRRQRADSYWVTKRQPGGTGDYFRQF
jgi:hypothetical protein